MMKGKLVWLVVIAVSLTALGAAGAQQVVGFRFEGQPEVRLNGEAVPVVADPLETYPLAPGDELCIAGNQGEGKVFLVLDVGERALRAGGECFVAPRPRTALDVVLKIFGLYNREDATVVAGMGQLRGAEDEAAAIYLPANLASPYLKLWFSGGPRPFELRLTSPEGTSAFEASEIIPGPGLDQVAFIIPAEAMLEANTLEVVKANGSRLYCGPVVVQEEVQPDGDKLGKAATELMLTAEWRFAPVVYTYLELALEQGEVDVEAREELQAELDVLKDFIETIYSVDSCN